MSVIKVDYGEVGGGGDISDMIGNTYVFTMYTDVRILFLAGINTIETWGEQYGYSLYSDSAKTNKIADVTTDHQIIDVSNYNVVYYTSAYSARLFDIKILG